MWYVLQSSVGGPNSIGCREGKGRGSVMHAGFKILALQCDHGPVSLKGEFVKAYLNFL